MVDTSGGLLVLIKNSPPSRINTDSEGSETDEDEEDNNSSFIWETMVGQYLRPKNHPLHQDYAVESGAIMDYAVHVN